MFQKRTFKKVDLFEGIGESSTMQEQQQQLTTKKVKTQAIQSEQHQILMPTQNETQKASYLVNDDYKDRFAVEVEREKSKDSTNPVTQTIQKFMQITSVDQIDPKKAMPNVTVTETPEIKRKKGQIVAPSNVRFTCRFDYNPSLCKDYHDTGYCTFGDSCIYIHDRGDYKSGWEQEKEWETQQRIRAQKLKNGDRLEDFDDEEMKEALSKYEVPETCPICSDTLNKPVMTKCDHYFCSKCAIDNFHKSPKCFVCQKVTHGIFHDARTSIKKIKEKRECLVKEYEKVKGRPKVPAKVERIAATELLNPQHLVHDDENPTIVAITEDDEIALVNQGFRKHKHTNNFKLTESDWLL